MLARTSPVKPLISLVPMIDVLLILLVFFMVTSTYLDLDMIPVVKRGNTSNGASQSLGQGDSSGGSLFVRVGEDGIPAIAGRAVPMNEISEIVEGRLAQSPELQIIVLPSGSAQLQSLVTLLDTVTQAGVTRIRVLRLDAPG